jgi:predicted aspartyl protease
VPTYSAPLQNLLGEQFPAPYLTVRVSWQGHDRELPGLIDTGADMTMIPIPIAALLGLPKISEADIEDSNGGSKTQDVFAGHIDFHGFSVPSLPMAGTDYPFMLIGRDVLSDFLTEMNGPAARFSLTRL